MRRSLLLACLLALALPASAAANEWGAFETVTAVPHDIARAPNGTLWFTADDGIVGRFDPLTELVTEFDHAQIGSAQSIAVAANGVVWVTDPANDGVWRLNPTSGAPSTEIDLSGDPSGIALSGTTMWVTRNAADEVTPIPVGSGLPGTSVELDAAAGPLDIARGDDGALWVLTDSDTAVKIVGSTPTDFAVSDGTGHITDGPLLDGAMWFTQPGSDAIGRVSATGTVTSYDLGTDSAPLGIATGADNSLWFTEPGNDRIGRMTTGGTLTRWLTPSEGGAPEAIVSDIVDRLWFAETGASAIGFITTEVGPAGPPGDDGDDGPQGPPGNPGAPGATGATGATGSQGATGAQGAAGATGAKGAKGDRGRRGRRGPRGPAGETPRVRCGSPGAQDRVRCQVVVGGGESRVALRLRLSRNGKLYATGARIARGRRTNVRLHPLRRMRPGRYTLLVVVGDGVRVKVPLRVR